MFNDENALQPLRRALEVSPENSILRQHLADTLLRLGRAEEAEQEYRVALSLAPGDTGLKLGLASAFHLQGKSSQALVIVEDVVRNEGAPAQAYLLHARLLVQTDALAEAAKQYRKARQLDPSLADKDLALSLGDAQEEGPGTDPLVIDGKVRVAWDEALAPLPVLPLERPALSFTDVGGMEDLKEEIRLKIIHPLEHADLYRAYGKAIGGGILLYGPPGCGKTYLARATAGEISAGFLSVGINDVLDMYLGNSERNLHDIFAQARANKPCVLFFDEVDALGASRSDFRHSSGRQIINQFLAELDGVDSDNEGLLILAATNAPWHLDPAFRRPGRFDRILFVPPPDEEARAAILSLLCRGKPLEPRLDFAAIAKKTGHFSGADLKALVDLAVEQKLREAMKSGLPTPLTTKDLLATAGAVKPTTREWFSTARNYAVYSNQGGLYDDILKYLKL